MQPNHVAPRRHDRETEASKPKETDDEEEQINADEATENHENYLWLGLPDRKPLLSRLPQPSIAIPRLASLRARPGIAPNAR